MSLLTMKDLQDTSKFSLVTEGIPEPLVYKSKADGKCWFVTNRPGRETEILSRYVALLDLESDKGLVYDSRNTIKLLPKYNNKPTLDELLDPFQYEKLTVGLPLVYYDIRTEYIKNYVFVDDAENILEHYVCLWNINGEFVWQEKETDLKKVINVAEALISNDMTLALLSSFGITIPEKLIKQLKIIFQATKDKNFNTLFKAFASEDLKKVKKIVQQINSITDETITLDKVKEIFAADETICKKLSELESFFGGEEKRTDSIVLFLQTIALINWQKLPD